MRRETVSDNREHADGDGSATKHLRDTEAQSTISRRGVLWRAGLATVGGVSALTLLDQRRAEAITGGNFILGQANDANATTTLTPTSGAPLKPLMHIDGSSMGITDTTLIVDGPTGGKSLQVNTGAGASGTVGIALGVSAAGGSTAISASSGSATAVSGTAGGTGGKGIWGHATGGHAVHGTASTGWGGFFEGSVYTTKFHEMKEITTPAAPAANHARLFLRDNGSGKTQLCVLFNTGGFQVIKTQP